MSRDLQSRERPSPAPEGEDHSEGRPAAPREIPAGIAEHYQAQVGGDGAGAPLPDPLRQQMEGSFDVDFSSVRVHQGTAARRMGALAYTQGEELHFAPGQYQPATRAGHALIGHELAHVVQQRAGRVSVPQGKGAPVNADEGLESEADDAGARAAAGQRATVVGSARGLQPKLVGSAPMQCTNDPDNLCPSGIDAFFQRVLKDGTKVYFNHKRGVWVYIDATSDTWCLCTPMQKLEIAMSTTPAPPRTGPQQSQAGTVTLPRRAPMSQSRAPEEEEEEPEEESDETAQSTNGADSKTPGRVEVRIRQLKTGAARNAASSARLVFGKHTKRSDNAADFAFQQAQQPNTEVTALAAFSNLSMEVSKGLDSEGLARAQVRAEGAPEAKEDEVAIMSQLGEVTHDEAKARLDKRAFDQRVRQQLAEPKNVALNRARGNRWGSLLGGPRVKTDLPCDDVTIVDKEPKMTELDIAESQDQDTVTAALVQQQLTHAKRSDIVSLGLTLDRLKSGTRGPNARRVETPWTPDMKSGGAGDAHSYENYQKAGHGGATAMDAKVREAKERAAKSGQTQRIADIAGAGLGSDDKVAAARAKEKADAALDAGADSVVIEREKEDGTLETEELTRPAPRSAPQRNLFVFGRRPGLMFTRPPMRPMQQKPAQPTARPPMSASGSQSQSRGSSLFRALTTEADGEKDLV